MNYELLVARYKIPRLDCVPLNTNEPLGINVPPDNPDAYTSPASGCR